MVKVSVVVPTYNAAPYIMETLQSILKQDYNDFEIVVVDDHSTDNTAEIINNLKDSRIKYKRLGKNHGGPSKPRNVGIRASKGKFIALCDSDDIMLPGRLRRTVDFLEMQKGLGLVFMKGQRFNSSKVGTLFPSSKEHVEFYNLQKRNVGKSFYIINSEDAFKCLVNETFLIPSGITIPNGIFKIVGDFDERLTNADDWDMWLRISNHYPIGFIDEIGFKYRVRSESVSTRGYLLAKNRIRVLRKHLKKFGKKSLRLSLRIRKRISDNLYSIGYAYQEQGNMKEARKYYLNSLKEYFNKISFRGFVITLLGASIVRFLKKYARN